MPRSLPIPFPSLVLRLVLAVVVVTAAAATPARVPFHVIVSIPCVWIERRWPLVASSVMFCLAVDVPSSGDRGRRHVASCTVVIHFTSAAILALDAARF